MAFLISQTHLKLSRHRLGDFKAVQTTGPEVSWTNLHDRPSKTISINKIDWENKTFTGTT